MDILQSFLSLSAPSPPTFREIFRSAQELRSALGMKSYLLDHYLSLFFQMVSQIDFIVLQDEAQSAMGEMHHLFFDTNQEASPKITAIMEQFPCQEVSTKQNLCLISTADFIFEQSLLDFLAKKKFSFLFRGHHRTPADREQNQRVHRQRKDGRLSKYPASSIFPLFSAPTFLPNHHLRTSQTIPNQRFGNGSGGLSIILESFSPMKKSGSGASS